jgi:hypothetical protein
MFLFRFSGRQQGPVTQRYSPAQSMGTILQAILVPSASQEVVRDLFKVNIIVVLQESATGHILRQT